MGLDLRIVEVGNNILQFKFSSRYQMEWVERNGPWNFDNFLIVLVEPNNDSTQKSKILNFNFESQTSNKQIVMQNT